MLQRTKASILTQVNASSRGADTEATPTRLPFPSPISFFSPSPWSSPFPVSGQDAPGKLAHVGFAPLAGLKAAATHPPELASPARWKRLCFS